MEAVAQVRNLRIKFLWKKLAIGHFGYELSIMENEQTEARNKFRESERHFENSNGNLRR